MVRDVGKHASWWFSIPGAGAFTQQLSKGTCRRQMYPLPLCAGPTPAPPTGRTLALQALKRAKYRELMLRELKGRTLKGCKLGTEYIVHDIIGADLVDW